MKLYRVCVSYVGYVLAEDEDEAREFIRDIEGDEIPDEECEEAHYVGDGWGPDSPVYHAGEADVTVREALEIAAGTRPAPVVGSGS